MLNRSSRKGSTDLPETGGGGGVAVAVRIDGKTESFNYGLADAAKDRRVTSARSSISPLSQSFATTLLAQAVSRASSVSRPVAKYVTSWSGAVISAG